MRSRFIQIHLLTFFSAALLVRGEDGAAKEITIGDASRTRFSSQATKRHIRAHEGAGAFSEMDVPDTVRSRHTFQVEVADVLIGEGFDVAKVQAVTSALADALLQKKAEKAGADDKKKGGKAGADDKKKDGSADGKIRFGQIVVLGRPEINYFRDVARKALSEPDPVKAVATYTKDAKKNIEALQNALHGGVGSALFGRMNTSDILSNQDAAVYVAHSFTTHAKQSEQDYFTAVDDLNASADESGSAHIGSTEITSGLFYTYVVVNVAQLMANMTGCSVAAWESADPELAAEAVRRLVNLLCTVSPGAKLGSTAPFSFASMVMVEGGRRQPRSLAGAFTKAVSTRGDVLQNSYAALSGHIASMDKMYPPTGESRYAVGLNLDPSSFNAKDGVNIDEISQIAASLVRS